MKESLKATFQLDQEKVSSHPRNFPFASKITIFFDFSNLMFFSE